MFEVWIIDRDTKRPEIHRLSDGKYADPQADGIGWVVSEAAGIRMQATDAGKLAIELVGDADTHAELPT